MKIKTTGWWTFFNGDYELTLQNYKDVLKSGTATGGFSDFFLNSVKIAIPGTLLPILVAALAAYAFSWMKFRGRDTLFIVVVALLVVPLQMALIPLLRLFTTGVHLGSVTLFPAIAGDGSWSFLRENPVQAWIAHACFAMPLAIFLLKNFISAMPSELIEAARVDGVGHLRIFYKIIIPLAVPALASLAIFQFLWVWNDYLVGYVFAGNTPPLPVKLVDIAGSPRRGVATAHRSRVRHDDRAVDRLLLPATVLRARPRDRSGQGVVATGPRLPRRACPGRPSTSCSPAWSRRCAWHGRPAANRAETTLVALTGALYGAEPCRRGGRATAPRRSGRGGGTSTGAGGP